MEISGYIFRIATRQWADQVFSAAVYYTGIRRKLRARALLFVHRVDDGDAIIGYGMVGNTYDKDGLTDEERAECKKHGWKKAIEFEYVMRLERPLLIKETILRDSKLRGRYFHGLHLDKRQLSSIMNDIETRGQTNQKS